MLQPNTLTFLKNLKANNNKPWFDANRTAYDAAKADFVSFVAQLIQGLSQVDPAIAETPLEAKNVSSALTATCVSQKIKTLTRAILGRGSTLVARK